MEEILEDLFKIYNSSIDSYNAKLAQRVNEKYTLIDRAMIASYLYIKILSNLNIEEAVSKDILINYLFKQVIYGETGNLGLEIANDSRKELYNKVLNNLILDKFEYKNRILKKLKYKYESIDNIEYVSLLEFCELVAETYIFDKLVRRGNVEALEIYNNEKIKLKNEFKENSEISKIEKEKNNIIQLILNNKFNDTEYYNLIQVALNLRDVYRYSSLTTVVPENVLFHQYTMTIANVMMVQYMISLGENIDIYSLTYKSLFHDFGEYKGNEIVTQIKNYNEDTKKMFAEIEENDEKELKLLIGNDLYTIIDNYVIGKEGYIADILDKILGIMKIWIEVGYMSNYTYIKAICSLFRERFEKFKDLSRLEEMKDKKFLLKLLKESYIYIKQNLINVNETILFKYFTKEEVKEIEKELENLKNTNI
ncbi:MAG: HD domain-containing protein [Clostridia bacterium]|nr:HD domain-containing protein [Clostridia bacterium]